MRPGHVRLHVAAAGVNRADLLQRRGLYPPPPGASDILGLECAGRITEIAPEVRGWTTGQTAMALLPGGGYAEQVVVPAGCLLPVSEPLDPTIAAAIPEALATVQMAVFDLGRLTAGEVLLLQGGSGGVGTLGIQLAARVGAVTVATAGSDQRCRLCEELGAGRAVNYRTEDFAVAVHEMSGNRGADVVLDCVGAQYLKRHLETLAVDGRLVVIGLQGGRRTTIDMAPLLSRRLEVFGTTLRSRPVADKTTILRAAWDRFGEAFAVGAIRPVVAATLPMEKVDEAHELLASGSAFGKIVLTFDRE